MSDTVLVGIDPSILEAKDYTIERLKEQNAALKEKLRVAEAVLDEIASFEVCNEPDAARKALAKIREEKP